MENISESQKKVILIYGNISHDIPHVRIKSREKITQSEFVFPRSMPVFLSSGLKEIGIKGIDIKFHEIFMNEYIQVIKENPANTANTFNDDLPIDLWISCIIHKLKSEFTICVFN